MGIFTQVMWAFAMLSYLSSPISAISLARPAPVPPTEDPFYSPPRGYETKAPGTILRHRIMPDPLVLVYNVTANIKMGFQILYRTTDALGDAQATVTTLLVPHNADKDKYLSYQTAEDSVFRNCAPSYGLQQGALNGSTGEIATIAAALYRGWYVSVPDYEGPKGAYTVGIQAAYGTLDNIRAVLGSGHFSNISADARTAMWGYSGGALATEWAAEFLSPYAPELKIVGAATGGLTPNVTSVFLTVNKGPDAALIPSGLNGFARAYPNMSKYLDTHLVPSMAATFRTPLTACVDAVYGIFAGQDIFKYFKDGSGILRDTIPVSLIKIAGIMGQRRTPTIPFYFYKAIADEISVISDTDALYTQYCSQGASIKYRRNRFGTHGLDYILGAPAAFSWLKDRLDDKEEDCECSVKNVTVKSLDPSVAALMGQASYEFLTLYLAAELQELGS